MLLPCPTYGRGMSNIAIVVDSIACITKEQAERYKIGIVPVSIFFNGKVYRDGVDLSAAQAYEFLSKASELWEASAASPEDYLRVYRELGQYAESILVITMSSELSMLYNSALLARELIKEELPQISIEVLDSQTAAAAEGLIALAAAQAATEGKTFDEVIVIAKKVSERVKFIGLLETIRHVYRTGRIPKAASQIGSMLSVKPLLTGSDGLIRFAATARTKQSGVEKMLHLMRNQAGNSEPIRVAVMHANTLTEAEELKDRIAAEFNCAELFITDFSPVMGYATGRGTLAVAFYRESDS